MPMVPSWSPPNDLELNINNCTAAGAFIANYFIAPTISDMSVDVVLSFLRSIDRSDWSGYEPQNWTRLQWWESQEEPDASGFVSNVTILFWSGSRCDREYCQFLPFEGDPDLAGIGMMISYYLVATLATAYVIIISLNCIKALQEYNPWRKLYKLFEQTINSFLDASLLFSISMLLAAIYRFISASQHPDRMDNTFFYSLVNAITIPIFSVFPPLMLQFPARKERRNGIRAVLWFLVIGFATTLYVLFYTYSEHDVDASDDENSIPAQDWWLSFCDLNDGNMFYAIDYSIIVALVVLGLNLPRWISLLFAVGKDRKILKRSSTPQGRVDNCLSQIWSRIQKLWGRYGNYARALNIILCCATMWMLLGIFTIMAVHKAEAMGQESKERQLSVGQVLSVATFVPLIIDIVAIAMESEDGKGLEGKLPRHMSVRIEKSSSAQAMSPWFSRYSNVHNSGISSEYEMLADAGRMQRV